MVGVKCPFCGSLERPFRYKSCYFIICNKCGIYAILNDMFDIEILNDMFEIERVKGFDKVNPSI